MPLQSLSRLAGTINLITKAPKTSVLNAGADFYSETSGEFNTTVHTSVGFKKQSLRFSGGRNYFDGWNPGDAEFYHTRTYKADSTRAQLWNPREQWFADAKYRRIFRNGYAEISGSWFEDEIVNRGMPRGAYKETAIDDIYRTLRYSLAGKIQFQMSSRWSSHHVLAYNRYRRNKSTYITDLTGVSSELSSNTSLQDTSAFSSILARGSFIGKISKTLDLQLGYEVEVETAEGKRIVDETGQIDNYALFATSEWHPGENWTVKPGLRWGYNSRYEAPVIPSINVLYQWPADIQTRVSYAQGFRAPGLKELAFYFVDVNHNIQGNEDLKAEQSHNFSASVTAAASDQREVGWALSGFYNRVYNLITLARETTTLYSYVNIGEQQTLGGKLETNTTIKTLDLAAAVSYTGVASNLEDTDGNPEFLFSPEATLRAGYPIGKSGINANLMYKYTGRQNYYLSDGEGIVTREYISDYQNLDLSLSRKFFDQRLDCRVGAKNIFNVQNIPATTGGGVHSGSPEIAIGTGRTWFVQVNLSFSKSGK